MLQAILERKQIARKHNKNKKKQREKQNGTPEDETLRRTIANNYGL